KRVMPNERHVERDEIQAAKLHEVGVNERVLSFAEPISIGWRHEGDVEGSNQIQVSTPANELGGEGGTIQGNVLIREGTQEPARNGDVANARAHAIGRL